MRIIITQGISLNFLEPPRTFSKSNCFEIDVYWLKAHLFVKETFLQKILVPLVNETRLQGVKRKGLGCTVFDDIKNFTFILIAFQKAHLNLGGGLFKKNLLSWNLLVSEN